MSAINSQTARVEQTEDGCFWAIIIGDEMHMQRRLVLKATDDQMAWYEMVICNLCAALFERQSGPDSAPPRDPSPEMAKVGGEWWSACLENYKPGHENAAIIWMSMYDAFLKNAAPQVRTGEAVLGQQTPVKDGETPSPAVAAPTPRTDRHYGRMPSGRQVRGTIHDYDHAAKLERELLVANAKLARIEARNKSQEWGDGIPKLVGGGAVSTSGTWSDEDRRLAGVTVEMLEKDWRDRERLTHHQGDLIVRALRAIALSARQPLKIETGTATTDVRPTGGWDASKVNITDTTAEKAND